MQSCCSPFASASAAAPRLRPLQLLLPDCIRFSCCSPIASASAAARCLCSLQLLLPNCVCFSCSLITSASTAAPQLRPLRLLLPDCVLFDCCSPIASACSPSCSGRFQPMPEPNVLEHSSQRSRFKYEGRVSLV